MSITELLIQIFDYELGKIERRDQMRVANILTNLKWKKAGQKQHQGRRQVVWIPMPPLKLSDIEEVLRREASPLGQPETQSQQEISIPAIPTTPIVESKNGLFEDEVKKTEKKIEQIKVEVLQKAEATEATSDWQSYPYNSKDVYTLKNRGEKVKQRLLECSTKGELINLYAQGLISAVEVKWLKANLLSQSECVRVSKAEETVQTNLFNQDRREELKAQTTKEIRRIGWGKKDGIKYIKEKYGKGDRALMSIEQLTEFRDYLTKL